MNLQAKILRLSKPIMHHVAQLLQSLGEFKHGTTRLLSKRRVEGNAGVARIRHVVVGWIGKLFQVVVVDQAF